MLENHFVFVGKNTFTLGQQFVKKGFLNMLHKSKKKQNKNTYLLFSIHNANVRNSSI